MLEPYEATIAHYAQAFGVPETWVKAVIMTESSGQPRAFRQESPGVASYGLMQVLNTTAAALGYTGTLEGLYDPDTNIRLGTKLIGQIRAVVGDDFRAMYSAYNSGKASNYLTNPTVAEHVRRAVVWLEKVLQEETLVVSSGAVGVLVISVLLWYWTKRKGK